MTLHYLDFDHSDDDQGHGCFDAMACVAPERLPALLDELTQVLGWAERQFPGRQGALADGADWDLDLLAVEDGGADLGLAWDAALVRARLHPPAPGVARVTLTLTLSGTAGFCEAFARRFLGAT